MVVVVYVCIDKSDNDSEENLPKGHYKDKDDNGDLDETVATHGPHTDVVLVAMVTVMMMIITAANT